MRNFLRRVLVAALLTVVTCLPGLASLLPFRDALDAGSAPQPVTTYDYDSLGRMTKRTLPGGQSESFTYDAVGNVATHTTFNAEFVTYAYDALNRVTTRRLPNEIITTTYTPKGGRAFVSLQIWALEVRGHGSLR